MSNYSNRSADNLTTSTRELTSYNCPFLGDTTAIKGVKIFFYCLVLLIAVIGNSLLIGVIKRNKKMQTVTNYLIANMAVADILTTLVAVPRHITYTMLEPERWLFGGMFGSILCKSLSFFQDVSTAVSIFSILAIAIDRYKGIVFPLRETNIRPTKSCKIILPLIWIVPAGIHVVYFYVFHTVTRDKKVYCVIDWGPTFDAKKPVEIYFIVMVTCEIYIPLCLIIWLYCAIIVNLKRSAIRRNRGPASCRTLRRIKEDRKVVNNIAAIVIAFMVSSIPINVIGVLFYFVWDWKIPCGAENFAFAAHIIFYSNPSVNPCIYFVLNDKYRHGLVRLFKTMVFIKKIENTDSKTSERETLNQKTWSSTFV